MSKSLKSAWSALVSWARPMRMLWASRILYRNLPCVPVLYAIADQNKSLAEKARRKLGFAKGYCDWQR